MGGANPLRLRTAALEYDLPGDRVATHPVEPRDSARLLVVDRRDPTRRAHRRVRDLPELLEAGDLVVFNSTRVLPARFRGVRVGTSGRIEGLYLHDDPSRGEGLRWVCLIKGRHTRAGAELELHDARGHPGGVRLVVVDRADDEPGAWVVRVEGAPTTAEVLERLGATPLPPYIRKARKELGEDPDAGDELDRRAYQTVYARDASPVGAHGERGSVAAPTAGLHFTRELLDRLAARGVRTAEVTLHVGAGTFKPVETEYLQDHPMHAEWCAMDAGAIDAVRRARAEGRRVVAIGTTSVRTLETYAPRVEGGGGAPGAIETRLLIAPGFAWGWTDALMTNFHLPRSTLLALVAAMLPPADDPERAVAALKEVYTEAIGLGYRFYSFGDAMLVV